MYSLPSERAVATANPRETQNGTDLVPRSNVPDWCRILVCSLASAAAGILHHKIVQKSEYVDKDDSEWYIFVPFSVSEQ